MAIGFVTRRADGEKVWLHAAPDAATAQRVRDVRWGDVLRIVADAGGGWTEIAWGEDAAFIRSEHITDTRPLEVLFVDVGQGDGCIVVSPEMGADERIFVVDAGQHDNMFEMIRWRFGKLERRFDFHAAVLTHADQDHYLGFKPLFEHEHVGFDRVYHNGLAERAGTAPLGASDAAGDYLVEPVEDDAAMRALYVDSDAHAGKQYAKVMRAALLGERVGAVRMLSTMHADREAGRAWMPGFAPSADRAWTVEVLGPIPEPDAAGRARLRWFGPTIGSRANDVGKTKNGHSILLRLEIGGLSVLLGGDLNRPAEDYLLRHYGAIAPTQPLADAVAPARARLRADVLKSCHHGAADVTDEFLRAVDAFAYVVSSGDDESHAHPRPDLLGRLGKRGRGDAPLILCTEILRSTRERGREDDFAQLRRLDATIDDADTPADARATARLERRALQDHIQKRNVGVYGAITLRSDGDHLEISFRLERPRGKQLWQTYAAHRDASGEWVMRGDDH